MLGLQALLCCTEQQHNSGKEIGKPEFTFLSKLKWSLLSQVAFSLVSIIILVKSRNTLTGLYLFLLLFKEVITAFQPHTYWVRLPSHCNLMPSVKDCISNSIAAGGIKQCHLGKWKFSLAMGKGGGIKAFCVLQTGRKGSVTAV